jgi:heavy metal sensor kinase
VRLTLWNVGVLALVLVVLGATLFYTVRANLAAAVDRDLAGRSRGVTAYWQQMDRKERAPWRPSRPAPYRPRVFHTSGASLFLPEDRPWDRETFSRSLSGQSAYSTIFVDETDEMVRVFSAPLRRSGSERVEGVVQVAQPLTDLQRGLTQLTRTLLTLIPVALLVAGAGGAFLTDRALRPVRRITQAASRIEARDLSGRLPVTGDDEFATLASTFNGMLGRLEEAFARLERAYEQQRRFAGDASHELRTPLTVIKANTSLALRGNRSAEEYRRALEAADRAADMTTGIVQNLLLLARSDSGRLDLDLQPAPLREILERAAEAAITTGPENAPLHWDLGSEEEEAQAAFWVLGDPHHLVRLFTNLLENAARHTPPDGRITLRARATECAGAAGAVLVEVEDTGEGIAPEHLPHVFERFYRVDAARSRASGGTGLGLAICRSIVEAHGGTIAVQSVPEKARDSPSRCPAPLRPRPRPADPALLAAPALGRVS